MTFQQLERAITSAHRSGDFRTAYDLEDERAHRIDAARQCEEMKSERTHDNSRRSFRG